MSKVPKSKISKWLRKRFKLVVYQALSLDTAGTYRINRLGFILINLLILLILMAIFWVIVVFTPLKTLIPGYPDNAIREHMITNKIRIDSLENEIRIRDNYMELLRNAILGVTPIDSLVNISIPESAYSDALDLNDHNSSAEIIVKDKSVSEDPTLLVLFPPAKGMITNSFEPVSGHFGTDIVPENNSSVYATKSGIVLLANYTIESGYSMVIQHESNLISVYKHNKELLVQQGDYVKTGQQIAIYGNTGEYSTGAHLHFEIWHNGKAKDPELYIEF